jgi:hypothetical protein
MCVCVMKADAIGWVASITVPPSEITSAPWRHFLWPTDRHVYATIRIKLCRAVTLRNAIKRTLYQNNVQDKVLRSRGIKYMYF